MDRWSDLSPHAPGRAAIPRLDDFDSQAFDALPIWGAPLQLPVVLIVDDEPDVGIILRRLLRDQLPHHEILVATDPTDALRRSADRSVALLIADVNMPDINGIQLAAKVKVRAPETPVMLISAYPTPLLDRLVQQRGILSYLPKPFALPDLERLVAAALGSG
jgi:two-component system, response regulator, stage 0 sporulation protein F